jgi:hypothetical protein
MSYVSTGLIESTDYNGFISTTNAGNLNAVWGTATSTGGYGQGNTATVAIGSTVNATQWSGLFGTIANAASHQGSTVTNRVPYPVAGNTIYANAAVQTDLNTIYANRANAASVGTQYTSWTGTSSKTSGTGSGSAAWTITFTHTITFANSSAYYSFFNSGGYLKWQIGKTSTGTVADLEWNAFAGTAGAGNKCSGTVVITGSGNVKTIAGTTYRGTTAINGSLTPTSIASATGACQYTTVPATIFQQLDTGTAYASNYIRINASADSNTAPTTITLTTTWYDAGDANTGSTAQITGGTAAAGVTFGTAPTTVVTYFPPETTYLTNTWGTPSISASVS